MKAKLITTAALVAIASSTIRAQIKPAEEKPTAEPAIEQVEKQLYLVDHLARVSENPTSSAIAAVLTAADVLKDNPQQAIDYFTHLLADVKSPPVARAVRFELAKLYARTGKTDQALEQLREVASGAGGPLTSSKPRRTESSEPANGRESERAPARSTR